jgi:hypothetical protein
MLVWREGGPGEGQVRIGLAGRRSRLQYPSFIRLGRVDADADADA